MIDNVITLMVQVLVVVILLVKVGTGIGIGRGKGRGIRKGIDIDTWKCIDIGVVGSSRCLCVCKLM